MSLASILLGFCAWTTQAQGHVATLSDPLLEHAIDNYKKTLGEAQNYTYLEHYTSGTFDSSGVDKLKFTDTYEILFLEGSPYKKHLLQNEKPLPAKEQKAEDRKLADVATARLQHKAAGLLHGSFEFVFPIDKLRAQFAIEGVGTENVGGRKCQVFLAGPKAAGDEFRQAARDGIAYEMKMWVDQQDGMFTKLEAKVLAAGMRYEKDTLVSYEFKKVNEEAWLPARFWFKGKVRYMMSDVPAEAEQTYSNYKKFATDSRLIVE